MIKSSTQIKNKMSKLRNRHSHRYCILNFSIKLIQSCVLLGQFSTTIYFIDLLVNAIPYNYNFRLNLIEKSKYNT